MEDFIYKKSNGQFMKGYCQYLYLDTAVSTTHELVPLYIFSDGSLQCATRELDLATLERLLHIGKLKFNLPEGSRVFVPTVGYVLLPNTPGTYNKMNIKQYIKSIRSQIEWLNKIPNAKIQCVYLFKEYLIDPSEENFNALEAAYNNIPGAEDECFVDYAPSKDPLIRLMTTKKPISEEQRIYYLKDYFESEWLEIK